MTILEIKKKLKNEEFEISLHAFEAAVDDYLSLNEVITAILQNGKMIEDDQQDFRCLIYCKSKRQHIHVAIAYYNLAESLDAKIEIVTIYKPDAALWINYRKRRK